MKIKKIDVFQVNLPYSDGVYRFVLAPKTPGLGVQPRLDILGTPLMSFN